MRAGIEMTYLLTSDARRIPLVDGLVVARRLGRRGVGIDLSYPYLRDQARTRLGLDKLDAWRDGRKEVETRLDELPLFEEMI